LGVDRIVVHPDGKGWTFEGMADIGPLPDMGALKVDAAPFRNVIVPFAGAVRKAA